MGAAGDLSFRIALLAGGCAGTTVDVALFPVDTIKTRCQTTEGFFAAGGFRGIYRGLTAAAVGSAPGAALFFSTYETVKPRIKSQMGDRPVAVQACAASAGEIMSSLVSVPTEVVKQRMQAGHFGSLREAAHSIMTKEGPKGFYTGYRTMLLREIPFALIQFPLWEGMKQEVGDWQGQPASPWQGAVCGSLAGSLSAAVTNPLDMVKTRQMLGQSSGGFTTTMSQVCGEEGAPALFRGVGPRTFWMGLGGFIFFGAYEKFSSLYASFVEARCFE
mmetsp:Transcript_19330/g.37226  ORF Transcript_19330/g.37226 Transcript_19330/m.37226 type:complete len:274 (-) Transcript_19330:375-1196(-)